MTRLTRAASTRPQSFNAANNTIEVVWTTGASVRRRDYRRDVTFDEILEVSASAVRLDRLNAGAPLLNSHDDSRLAAVIGAVVPGSARIEGGLGIARVRLSSATGDADIVAKIRDGIVRSISVGYVIHAFKTESGSNGADEVRRAVDWEPLEISAVPIPADAGAHFRSQEQPASVDDVRARMEARHRAAGLAVADETTSKAIMPVQIAGEHRYFFYSR